MSAGPGARPLIAVKVRPGPACDCCGMDKRRILVIQGHPDRAALHLCHALGDAYAAGAVAAGHAVRRIDVATLAVPQLVTQAAFEGGPVPPGAAAAQGDIAWADHIVLIFPLWLGTMPALVKGFLEQVLRPHFAFAYTPRGFAKKLLAGRSARLVVTMGMPALVYRWYFLAHGLKGLERNILAFVGISPVRTTLLGGVGGASAATRSGWLAKMTDLGRRGR